MVGPDLSLGWAKNDVTLGAQDAVTRLKCFCPCIWLQVEASPMLKDSPHSLHLGYFSHLESLANQALYLRLSSQPLENLHLPIVGQKVRQCSTVKHLALGAQLFGRLLRTGEVAALRRCVYFSTLRGTPVVKT